MLSDFGRRYLSKPIGRPIARVMAKFGILPNQLTALGLVLSLISAILFAQGRFAAGGVFLLLSGVFDLLDGQLAKIANRVTFWGAYLDSVTDRYSDTLVFLGLAWYYTQHQEPIYVILVSLTITGALLVSYTKARAETIIKDFSSGLMERPERIILLAIGAFLGDKVMRFILWSLVLLVHFTALERVIYTHKRIRGDKKDE